MPTLIVTPVAAACWVFLSRGDMDGFFASGMHCDLPGAWGVYLFAEFWMG